jgi:hypothetical protein
MAARYWLSIDGKPGVPPHELTREAERHDFSREISTTSLPTFLRWLELRLLAGFICRAYQVEE